MALQIALPADDSLVKAPFPASYARIEFWQGWKSHILLHVNWYADEAARLAAGQPVKQNVFQMDIAIGQAVSQGEMYDFLKAQPEFAGAVDV